MPGVGRIAILLEPGGAGVGWITPAEWRRSSHAGKVGRTIMEPHKVVSQDEWIAARKAHLADEKTFTKARDALSKKRRELPWEKVEKNYVFDTPTASSRWPICSAAKASSSSITSCSVPAGKPAARAARYRRSFRRRHHPSGAARRHLRRRFARAAAGNREVQKPHGLEVQMGVVVRLRLQPRLSGIGVAGRESLRQGDVQLRGDRVPERRAARRQRVLQE